MYGEINHGIKTFVLTKFGKDVWDQVIEKSSLNDLKHFVSFKSYDDDVFMTLVGTTAHITGLSEAKVLENYGNHFLTYCRTIGYEKMLFALGEDLFTFIQNLDSLHALLSISYKELRPPSFRCEKLDEKNLILHYFSSRRGLFPMVKGLMVAVGRDLFQTEVTCEVVENMHEVVNETFQQHHVVFKLTYIKAIEPAESLAADNTDVVEFIEKAKSSSAMAAPVTAKIFRDLFPYHIMFDQNLKVIHIGVYLQKILQKELAMGNLTGIVTILEPKVKPNFEAMLKAMKETFVFQIKGFNESFGQENLLIKGQLYYLFERRQMIFIGSPTLTSFSEKHKKDGILSSIPLHEVGDDVKMLNKLREAEIGISMQLERTMNDLKRVKVSLKKEKQKNDKFLYEMLPVSVADALQEGNQVPAENFANSTILFSDMRSVAGISDPIEIVSLLNQLYELFDSLTAPYSVVKIQTKTDVYMVVGGVPYLSDQHAEHVACFALEIVDQALKIQSTATGSPIKIRVGIHSGPVVAGVVGQKLPRYCLFGETVDVASSMESQGEAGKVHCSSATYNILKDNADFTFEERGEIDVPDKERMITYFLKSGDRQKYKKEIAEEVSLEAESVDDESVAVVEKESVDEPKTSTKSKMCGIL